MSLIGRKVQQYKVQAYQMGTFKTLTSEDARGKWAVYFFYPADFSFVCPTELSELADKYVLFQEAGCEIYSVSTDSHFVHKAWADTAATIEKIKFPMLADPTGTMARAFEVMDEEEGMALRGSFVVNPDGIIKAYEIHENGIGRDADELLRKVQAAKFLAEHGDKVCPAKWKPGTETLTPSLDLIGKL